jgi:hypothetical protein
MTTIADLIAEHREHRAWGVVLLLRWLIREMDGSAVGPLETWTRPVWR